MFGIATCLPVLQCLTAWGGKDGDAHLQKDTGKSGNLVGQRSERWIGGRLSMFIKQRVALPKLMSGKDQSV